MTIDNVAAGQNIDPDWGNAVADAINEMHLPFEGGSYTPSLTNITVGTGGSATLSANYAFVGGPNVGDVGILSINVRIHLGTSGASVGTNPQVGLPAGFQWIDGNGNTPKGSSLMMDSDGSDSIGVSTGWSGTTVRAVSTGAAQVTSTSPFTWTSGDIYSLVATAPAVRV